MVGFPVELIKKELFDGDEVSNECTMEQLREVMLSYLNKTMLDE